MNNVFCSHKWSTSICKHSKRVDKTTGEKDRIRPLPILWIYRGPFVMDGRGWVWFQGCSFLICEGSLAEDGFLLEALAVAALAVEYVQGAFSSIELLLQRTDRMREGGREGGRYRGREREKQRETERQSEREREREREITRVAHAL